MTPQRTDEPNAPNLTAEETRTLQDWLASPAPGEDKLQHLHVTLAPAPTRRPARGLPWYFQVAAGLALFFAGYLSGNRKPQANVTTANTPATPASPVQVSPPPEPVLVADNDSPGPSAHTTPPPETASPNPTDHCNTPQFYQGEDGRLRIDTVLCKTGSHATWVVNPRLEIANLKQDKPNVEEN